jgi:drug/metabolite transporter (DMT)-like permease
MWVGLFSLLGSIGWAWAFTLESAAKVRTLGQVELVIAFAIAHITLGERHGRGDYLASGTVLAGVVIVTVLG